MPRFALALLLLTLAGCRVETSGNATVVAAGDTLVATSSEDGPVSPAEGFDVDTAPGCTLIAQDSVALYARPSVAAVRFGVLAPGDSVRASGRAAGFVGIDPGVAQAASVGPFRLRYASADGAFSLRGAACAALPQQPRVDPVACYAMAQRALRLHARPDTASAVVATLPAQGFAEATQKTPTGWLRVRLGQNGPPGWLAPADVNVSGPACGGL